MDATYVVTTPSSTRTGLPTQCVRESFPPKDAPLESYQVNCANLLILTIISDDAEEHRQVYRKQNSGWLWHRWLVERRWNGWRREPTQENSGVGPEVAGDGALENSVLGKDTNRRNTWGRLHLVGSFWLHFRVHTLMRIAWSISRSFSGSSWSTSRTDSTGSTRDERRRSGTRQCATRHQYSTGWKIIFLPCFQSLILGR